MFQQRQTGLVNEAAGEKIERVGTHFKWPDTVLKFDGPQSRYIRSLGLGPQSIASQCCSGSLSNSVT